MLNFVDILKNIGDNVNICNMLNVINRKMINAIGLNSYCNLKEKANADIKLLHLHFTLKIFETNYNGTSFYKRKQT